MLVYTFSWQAKITFLPLPPRVTSLARLYNLPAPRVARDSLAPPAILLLLRAYRARRSRHRTGTSGERGKQAATLCDTRMRLRPTISPRRRCDTSPAANSYARRRAANAHLAFFISRWHTSALI